MVISPAVCRLWPQGIWLIPFPLPSVHHPLGQVLLRARSSPSFFNNWKWHPWLGHFTLNSPLEEVRNRGCLRQRDLAGKIGLFLFYFLFAFSFFFPCLFSFFLCLLPFFVQIMTHSRIAVCNPHLLFLSWSLTFLLIIVRFLCLFSQESC